MIYTAIDTFYLTDEQLQESPSLKDGIDATTENALRVYGAELIQESGILLKLPQAAMATGQVLFHRFYCKKSLARFNVKRVAASCVWLAAKLEEYPKKVRDVINVFYRMEQRREGLPVEPLEPFSKQYEELKTDLVRTERHLLKEMGFICHVEHPHKFLFTYLQQLEVSDDKVKQEAWNLANDSLRTTLCVRFKSEVIACGVIYAATRRAQIPLPENPPWWLVFDAQKSQIDEICRVLAEMYKMPKAKYIEVGKESKSFVLKTRAWDPPAEPQELLGALKQPPAVPGSVKSNLEEVPKTELKAVVVEVESQVEEGEMVSAEQVQSAETLTKTDPSGDLPQETQASEKQLDEVTGVEQTEAKERDAIGERDKERIQVRERERKEREREREPEKDVNKSRNRERSELHRDRGRGRDSGHTNKYPSAASRDREKAMQNRDKDRGRRYHPYDRVTGRK